MIRIYLRHIRKITVRERKEILIPHRFLAVVTREMFPWTNEGEAGWSCKHIPIQIGYPRLQAHLEKMLFPSSTFHSDHMNQKDSVMSNMMLLF